MAAGLMERSSIFFLTLVTGICALEVGFDNAMTGLYGDGFMIIEPPELPDKCNTTYDAVALLRNELFIFKGKYFWRKGEHGFYLDGPIRSEPMETSGLWSLPTDFTHVDAVYERPDDNIAVFIGKQLYLYNDLPNVLPGYPKQLSSLGLPESLQKLDAAMVWGQNNKTYFYSGKMFWRFDEEEGRVEMDYPRDMAMWKGIGYDIDSGFTWKDGKTYFFKGKGFWKFDNNKMQVEQSEQFPSAQFWMGCQELPSTTTIPSITVMDSDADRVTTRPERNCTLPQYPDHGSYITSAPDSKPGQAYDIFAVNVSCQEGYITNRPHFIFCYRGQWSSQMPQCVPMCRLPLHSSVEYRCLVSLDWMDGFRACNKYEPSGTLVKPLCRTHYYSTSTLKYMHCIGGEWSNIPKCNTECGTLIPIGTQLVMGGETADLGEVPWHVGIYTKTTQPYKQICGGSLISTNTVISAAHCFWNNLVGMQPASNFAVAAGKLYRPWDNKSDKPQRSDVESIHLPVRFRGSATNFQEDIAVVVLSTAVLYNTYIRPVCVDFDVNFERRQLQPGKNGKVAGWGLTSVNGNASQVLRVVDLPYVSIETCIDNSPASFSPYITSDKICAGFNNAGTALCKGDSGGGLAFPELDKGTLRYYLRGVTSTAPTNENLCNANSYISFTRLTNHEHFITMFWDD